MWFCIIGLTSGREKNLTFYNKLEANDFFDNINSIIDRNNGLNFAAVGSTKLKINLNNVEWVTKPEPFKDEWDKEKK